MYNFDVTDEIEVLSDNQHAFNTTCTLPKIQASEEYRADEKIICRAENNGQITNKKYTVSSKTVFPFNAMYLTYFKADIISENFTINPYKRLTNSFL